jgi:predicted metal-dependent hydrolase
VTSYAYSVRFSPRAKSARIKLSASDGLIVVVPAGFDPDRISALVDAKRDWIARAVERLEERRGFLAAKPRLVLPDQVLLRAIGEGWSTEYRQTSARSVTAVERSGKRLLVYGDVSDERAARAAVRRWVARKTREHLEPWLLSLARENDFMIKEVHIKSQRTRWASCSATGTISLNLRLMFLPSHLVHYVLLHELTHTREMNHSRRFWAQVADVVPNFEAADQELREGWRLIPTWIDDLRGRDVLATI